MIAALLVVIVLASDDGAARVRIDRFSVDGERRGHTVIDRKTGRFDTYDKDSKRTGYGVIRPDGAVDRYHIDGRRRGTPKR